MSFLMTFPLESLYLTWTLEQQLCITSFCVIVWWIQLDFSFWFTLFTCNCSKQEVYVKISYNFFFKYISKCVRTLTSSIIKITFSNGQGSLNFSSFHFFSNCRIVLLIIEYTFSNLFDHLFVFTDLTFD